MPLAFIIPHIILLSLTITAIFYPVHQKYPFKKGAQITTEQHLAIQWRAFIYFTLMLGVSVLIIYPVVYREVYLGG